MVVPRKGDVDRNKLAKQQLDVGDSVVPRKGDVDRNDRLKMEVDEALGRPPQGGRG